MLSPFIFDQRNGEIKFWEAECLNIDPTNKKVFCRSNIDENLAGNNEFSLEYDYLVIAMGAKVNTFNTPGVLDHCHFLKVINIRVLQGIWLLLDHLLLRSNGNSCRK